MKSVASPEAPELNGRGPHRGAERRVALRVRCGLRELVAAIEEEIVGVVIGVVTYRSEWAGNLATTTTSMSMRPPYADLKLSHKKY